MFLFKRNCCISLTILWSKSSCPIKPQRWIRNGEYKFYRIGSHCQLKNTVGPDESGQTLRNLVELTTEMFRKDGIDISNYIMNGHLLSHNSVFDILKPKAVDWRLLTTPLEFFYLKKLLFLHDWLVKQWNNVANKALISFITRKLLSL